MTPDFRILGVVKGENGLRRGVEEEDEDAEEPEETADGGLEQPGRKPGNPDVPRETADPMQEGRREETRRNRHVPGGAWLSKSNALTIYISPYPDLPSLLFLFRYALGSLTKDRHRSRGELGRKDKRDTLRDKDTPTHKFDIIQKL
ncbi:hypothetical protein NDU88_006287 [Pleurodeles waltl]|uniref:Uncharacterized protein n=1 Tax=Pleurodeles waltl TaxID=8319 RepID=A0AAV7UPK0_PLEWA|nr:hypothetical protein NDU88_006287 [Pleurodeles waltl]